MATKPISTIVFDFMKDTVDIVLFCVFCNPLSLFFMNLVWPAKASALVRSEFLFGPTACAWYTKQALKWPFLWAKYWISLDNLAQHNQALQMRYFMRYRPEEAVLKAMSQDAVEQLFCAHGNEKLPITEQRRRKECTGTVCWLHTLTVAELIIRNFRLSYLMLHKAIQYEMYDELRNYVTHGALPAGQLQLLIEEVFKKEDFPLFGVLMEHTKRYGLTDEQRQQILQHGKHSCARLLLEENTAYDQRKVVLHYYEMNVPKIRESWHCYCKNLYNNNEVLFPEAQREMSVAQYKVFHATGNYLSPEGILDLLKSNDQRMWTEIFKLEPNHGLLNEKIKSFIAGNEQLQKVFESVCG
ncbi:MAG: hypothetical protein J6Y91_01450 [Alphaproteobacteria bacterium]|nr:hypothetical protein [Paludibacteraceae bacterium]MBP5352416.1 hypothetical protein [Alphaproteobacteria bacterium]